jgi:predicted dehydrogenase
LNTEKDGRQFSRRYETLAGNYSLFYGNIFDSITHGKESAVKPDEALNVIRIIKAAQKSSSQQKTITIK